MSQLPPVPSTPSAGRINPNAPAILSPLLEKTDRVYTAAAHTGIIELSGQPVPFTINPIVRKNISAAMFDPSLSADRKAQCLFGIQRDAIKKSQPLDIPSLPIESPQLSNLTALKAAIRSLKQPHAMMKIEGEPGQQHYTPTTRSFLARMFSWFTARTPESQSTALTLATALHCLSQQAVEHKDYKTLGELSTLLEQLKTNSWFRDVCKNNRKIQKTTDLTQNTLTSLAQQHTADLKTALQHGDTTTAIDSFRQLQEAKTAIYPCSKELHQEMSQLYLSTEKFFVTAMIEHLPLREAFMQDAKNFRLLSQEGRKLLFIAAKKLPEEERNGIQSQIRIANMQDALDIALNPAASVSQGDSMTQSPITRDRIGTSIPIGFLSITKNLDEIASAFQLYSQTMNPAFQASFKEKLEKFIHTFEGSALLTDTAKQTIKSVMATMDSKRAESLFTTRQLPTPPIRGTQTLDAARKGLDRQQLINSLVDDLTTVTASYYQEMDPALLVEQSFRELKSKEMEITRELSFFDKEIAKRNAEIQTLQQTKPPNFEAMIAANQKLIAGNTKGKTKHLEQLKAIQDRLDEVGKYLESIEAPKTKLAALYNLSRRLTK